MRVRHCCAAGPVAGKLIVVGWWGRVETERVVCYKYEFMSHIFFVSVSKCNLEVAIYNKLWVRNVKMTTNCQVACHFPVLLLFRKIYLYTFALQTWK